MFQKIRRVAPIVRPALVALGALYLVIVSEVPEVDVVGLVVALVSSLDFLVTLPRRAAKAKPAEKGGGRRTPTKGAEKTPQPRQRGRRNARTPRRDT